MTLHELVFKAFHFGKSERDYLLEKRVKLEIAAEEEEKLAALRLAKNIEAERLKAAEATRPQSAMLKGSAVAGKGILNLVSKIKVDKNFLGTQPSPTNNKKERVKRVGHVKREATYDDMFKLNLE